MKLSRIFATFAIITGSFAAASPTMAVTHDQICQANKDQCLIGKLPFRQRRKMKLMHLLVACAGTLLAITSAPAMAAIVSLQCTFSQSLVGEGYDSNFPRILNIWIHTGKSVADVQRYLDGYGWDSAPTPHPVRISTGFYQVDIGNGGFLISIVINRMTGAGQYANTVMFVPQNHAPLVANYSCVKNNAPLPVGKF